MYKYTKSGIYAVTLTVSNAAGTGTMTKHNYINITASQKPVTAFSASTTSGTAPLSVIFTDTSTNSPTSWTEVLEIKYIQKLKNYSPYQKQ